MSPRKQLDFGPSGFFALRTPLLSFEEILRRPDLADVIRRPEVREAIFLASPKLESQIDGWLGDSPENRDVKVRRALTRYFLRMSARPTPFGTLAGTSVGRVGEATDIRLSEPADHRRRTRLDMHYLSALAEALQDPSLIRSLRLHPNTSLYEAAGRLRYAEARYEGGARRYRLVAVEPTEGVVIVLGRARDGASFDDLVDALVDDEVTEADASAFVFRLIESQLLVSDLEPSVTGVDALDSILETLGSISEASGPAIVLKEARAALESIDAA
ncbi:MAG TPA: lantibiotic dehydratase, partial [Actinomycetota bacterium]|nr:lantibiotic dehydratase [Actinomycetota bacterium]